MTGYFCIIGPWGAYRGASWRVLTLKKKKQIVNFKEIIYFSWETHNGIIRAQVTFISIHSWFPLSLKIIWEKNSWLRLNITSIWNWRRNWQGQISLLFGRYMQNYPLNACVWKVSSPYFLAKSQPIFLDFLGPPWFPIG